MIRRRAQRGQTLVEFALVAPLFFLLVIGIINVGYAIYAYNTVANAARVATRTAIVNQSAADVEAEARRLTVALGDDLITVTQGACATLGCSYSVTVEYDFQPVAPLIANLFDPTISSTAVMPIESVNP